MTKLIKIVWSLALVLILFFFGMLLADKQTLQNDVIRLHVVANSDSEEDQNVKLAVRDAVITYIQNHIGLGVDTAQAKKCLQENLDGIEAVANDALHLMGKQEKASVTLTRESFGLRAYDTFSLPSGVYESLRVEIGDGEGKNWWCVVFPALCMPATKADFKDTAVSAGFDSGLAGALSGEEGYEVRFFLLDCMGKIENFFHKS